MLTVALGRINQKERLCARQVLHWSINTELSNGFALPKQSLHRGKQNTGKTARALVEIYKTISNELLKSRNFNSR
uniref:Uncharacterized protein n=1 Tax=Arundo donax TaxID=35708 RepID=A0A0A9DJS1_ARUDO